MRSRIIIWLCAFLVVSCAEEYNKNPLDELEKKLSAKQQYSVILQDMDVQGEKFYHKFKVISLRDTLPVDSTTGWMQVSEEQFFQYENDLGMEIMTKDSAGVHRSVSPPGYNHYVGNSRYGHWQTDSNGNRMWVFLGQYYFLRTMLGLGGYPLYYGGYYDYYNNYRYRRPYYGRSGSSYNWGTRSTHTRTQRKDFFQRKTRKNNFQPSRSRGFGGGSRGRGFGK